MTQGDRDQLRSTFDQDAERYDRARPGYPAALFDDLAELGTIGPGSRVLEIGPGTGQATLPLAERGYQVVAVELGADLAAVARRNLAHFPAVKIVTAAFEDWPLPAERFDLVLAATAFHWIDPSMRVEKVADALRPGGSLATVTTHHVAGGDESFFAEVQDCYVRWDPDTPTALSLTPAIDIPTTHYDLDQSRRFGSPEVRPLRMGPSYTTASYLDLLLTYSGHRALEPASQRNLLDCIARLIDTGYGGQITKRYLTELRVAPTVGP
jgi:SAM-dependent methyltransferase